MRRRILALCLLLSCAATATGAEPIRLVLFHTNDMHGQCGPIPAPWIDRNAPPRAGGIARLAGRIAAERRAEPDAVLVDAGDWFRGTPEGALEDGLGFARLMARLGFDAVCVGNHELDHGVANLERMLADTRLPAVLANVRDPATERGLKGTTPWTIVERRGVRVAFVGLLTTVTPDITHADARRLEFEPPAVAWDRACRELAGKADFIIPLTHLPVPEARDLARARPDIPLIISAHDHTRLEQGVREGATLIVQNGAKAVSLGRIELVLDGDTRRVQKCEARLIDLVEPSEALADPALAAACEELVARTSKHMDEVVGSLSAACERGSHRLSSPQGNWICDALLRTSGARVAIQNKGGTRCDLSPGPLTRRHLFELLPFENTVVSMSLTGEALEALVRRGVEDTRHRGLDVAGIAVYVRPKPDGALLFDRIEIDGKPLDPRQSYRVVTSSYLAGGEGGYVEFRSGKERREIPILMREMMEEDVRRVGEVKPPEDARIIARPEPATGSDAVPGGAPPVRSRRRPCRRPRSSSSPSCPRTGSSPSSRPSGRRPRPGRPPSPLPRCVAGAWPGSRSPPAD